MRKLCCEPGCDDLAEPARNRCSEHLAPWLAKQAGRKAAAKSGAAARAGAEFYRTERWRAGRLSFLARHPLCADCGSLGQVVAATEVDHITPHRGDARLMWDRRNWQGLCKPCHSRKTAREVWHGAGRDGAD
ncbi:HNH endonuclease [Falsirhodobacter halotolerans]|uniref:HNH endonuclease n=1 Tax=Falsirhodobacter halotolerans TaxID=1146892 RepID=UPI001FD5E7EB|nr:HNH endonuclease [Falsirhodobacter halotolerans]